MARKCQTNKLWDPPAAANRPTITVTERGKPEDDRQGVQFGFGRELNSQPQTPRMHTPRPWRG
jgi:hypothetical protein